ncbi:uncharacterized protein LOC108742940 isoform X2 [Agrilus planipennis]|uniref:Uncharacterized protein LOC108742940 isoform X2 n=1 Tax=Agrilus planipennis TaxID=224129 RepID=A0A1W4XCS9_AGRPL|nr:uncharacterized protein LOC108742940 isoform X2 [Agrilus planipennis]
MQRQTFKSTSTSKTCRDCTRLTAPSSLFPSKQLTQKPKQTNIKSKEVTVKTLNANGPSATKKKDTQSTGARETWGDMLKAGKSVSNLNKFDPLRTLNFLINELQDKLQNLSDVNVQQIITDMHNIVKRMPTENSVTIKQRAMSESRKPRPINTTKLIKIASTASQTEPILDNTTVETEKFRKQWEESSKKLEINCKQLENLCSRYKREKEEIELLLKAEKDTVKYLRKKNEETKQNKEIESKFQEMKTLNSTLQMRLQEVKLENGNLQAEIRRLKTQIEMETSPSKRELKALVSDLHAQKSICDQEIIVLKHHLAKVNMEKEKFQTICNLRTKQVEEIQSEMLQLQKIVDENILDLQRTTFQPISSGGATNAGEFFESIPMAELMNNVSKSTREGTTKKATEEEQMGKEMGDNNTMPSTINSDESTQAFFLKDPPSDKLSFKELPSGDSSNHFLLRISSSESSTPRKKQRHPEPISRCLNKDRFDIPTLGEIHNTDAQANIREMFAELKRQALQVFPTLNIPSSLEFSDK